MSVRSRPDDRHTINSGKGIITIEVFYEDDHDRVDIRYDDDSETFRIKNGEAVYQGGGEPEQWAHNAIRDLGARLG